jgi:23S rRNA U2552 (ribose-2'-O)-methylase RlmE/FtsJ
MSYTEKPPEPWDTITWRTTRIKLEPSDNTDAVLLSGTPETLSTLKDRIAELDDDIWDYYKKITNKYELIFTAASKIPIPASVCSLKPLSRSYFKMIEILGVFDIMSCLPRSIRTGHVCEGPGGFIQAIYDMADRSHVTITRTAAMTLKPIHQYVPGWKRASNFLKRHPQIKIMYGDAGTGDILDGTNRESYVGETRRSIHIFTADGGVDFTTNYRGQEQTIFPILVASSLMAVKSLAAGGVFVLKVFDCFGENTLDLLIGIGSLFQKWTLYKPATSRPCNSEQYFVGIGFNPISPNCHLFTNVLTACLETGRFKHRLLKNLPSDMVAGLLDEQFARIHAQIENLEWTFDIASVHGEESTVHEVLWRRNIEACQAFCRKFKLPLAAG